MSFTKQSRTNTQFELSSLSVVGFWLENRYAARPRANCFEFQRISCTSLPPNRSFYPSNFLQLHPTSDCRLSRLSRLRCFHACRRPLFQVLGVLTLAAWNFYLTAVGFFALWFPGYQWPFVASMTYQARVVTLGCPDACRNS